MEKQTNWTVTEIKEEKEKDENVIKCDCCGEYIVKDKTVLVKTENGNKRICVYCYKHRYCRKCEKIDYTNQEKFKQFVEDHQIFSVCDQCLGEITKECQNCLCRFIEYTKIFYGPEKCRSYYCASDSNHIVDFIQKDENFKRLVASSIRERSTIPIYFKVFQNLVGKDFDDEYALKALWNDFLIKNSDLEYVSEDVFVEKGCKRCGKTIEIEYEYETPKKFFVTVNDKPVYDSAYNLYLRVKNDPNFKCSNCEAWVDIIGELRKNFGWMPNWQTAVDQFEEFGKGKDCQAGPIDFHRFLSKNNIVMTQQIQDAWNRIYDRRKGNCIIKCYSIPDSDVGKSFQTLNRVTGGFLQNTLGYFEKKMRK